MFFGEFVEFFGYVGVLGFRIGYFFGDVYDVDVSGDDGV